MLAVVDHKPAPGTALPCCCCRRVRCCWCCCRIPRWGCVLLSIAAVLCVLATAATCVYFLVIHKHVPEYFPPSGPCPRACACRLRAPCFRGPHVCWTCGCGCFYVLAMCVCACACVCVWLCVAVCGCVWLCVAWSLHCPVQRCDGMRARTHAKRSDIGRPMVCHLHMSTLQSLPLGRVRCLCVGPRHPTKETTPSKPRTGG